MPLLEGHKIRRLATCSLLITLALVLSVTEKMFPLALLIPIPGIKLGLANVITLFALLALSKRDAAVILFCRITLGSVFAGSITGFLFSVCGGFLSLVVMSFLLYCNQKSNFFSLLGISMAGAAAHNIGQILAAMFTLGTVHVFGYLPLLLLSAIPIGLITGFICQLVFDHLKKIQAF